MPTLPTLTPSLHPPSWQGAAPGCCSSVQSRAGTGISWASLAAETPRLFPSCQARCEGRAGVIFLSLGFLGARRVSGWALA